jgi:hypothetical protein
MTDKDRIAELEAANARLKEAIEWAEECLSEEAAPHRADELRTRAFPPQFETVDIKRFYCGSCGNVSAVDLYCCGRETTTLTGQHKRPVKPKVKHREEMELFSANGDCVKLCKKIGNGYEDYINSRYFREYEE